MGVYIKGMEMPKTCRDCEYCWFRTSGLKTCEAKDKLPVGDRWDIERASFCPLIEVPEPHGRLIDADACIDYIRSNNQHAWEVLAYAPTVIESEVEE